MHAAVFLLLLIKLKLFEVMFRLVMFKDWFLDISMLKIWAWIFKLIKFYGLYGIIVKLRFF